MKTALKPAATLLLISCTISFICFFGSYMRIPIVPLFAASLGADTVQVGMINGAFMFMAGALSIPAGLISDRVGRRLPLLAGLNLLAGSSFLLYWCNSPLQMSLVYLLFGIGLSAFSPTLMSYVADITPPDKLGRAYGWYTMALYGGMTLGPAAGGFLGSALGLRPVFLVSGSLIFTMFLVALFFLPAHRSEQIASAKPRKILPMLKNLLQNRSLIACLIATLGGCVGFGMFITFMPLYIRSLGMNSRQMGLVFAAQALANALSRIPSGRLSDKVRNPSLFVIIGLALFAVSLAGFSYCESLSALMVTAVFMGLSMGSAFTVISALIADAVPRQLRGIAMGCYNTCIYAGMMISSIGLGRVIRGEGFRVGFLLSGSACILVMLIFHLLYQRQYIAGQTT